MARFTEQDINAAFRAILDHNARETDVAMIEYGGSSLKATADFIWDHYKPFGYESAEAVRLAISLALRPMADATCTRTDAHSLAECADYPQEPEDAPAEPEHRVICDGTGHCADLPHVVLSTDPDECDDGPVVWGILANHAEFVVAQPVLDRYAEETDGVESVWVVVSEFKTGAVLRDQVESGLEQMDVEFTEFGIVEEG